MRYSTIFFDNLAVGYFSGATMYIVEARITCTWRSGVLNCLLLIRNVH